MRNISRPRCRPIGRGDLRRVVATRPTWSLLLKHVTGGPHDYYSHTCLFDSPKLLPFASTSVPRMSLVLMIDFCCLSRIPPTVQAQPLTSKQSTNIYLNWKLETLA